MIYFRGCTARQKETSIADATEKLLKHAGIDFRVLDDEKCCGSVLMRTGFCDEASKQIAMNTEILKGETVLTSCAGCYNTFLNDYEDIEVIHISQLLNQLINEGKLKFNKKDLKVTFHDSCHLARHCKVFDEPRNVISHLANLVEMENNRENSLCCGAGGGVKSAYPDIAYEISKLKIKQAKDTGAEILVTSCPFCKLNLVNDDLNVMDIVEFLAEFGDLYEKQ